MKNNSLYILITFSCLSLFSFTCTSGFSMQGTDGLDEPTQYRTAFIETRTDHSAQNSTQSCLLNTCKLAIVLTPPIVAFQNNVPISLCLAFSVINLVALNIHYHAEYGHVLFPKGQQNSDRKSNLNTMACILFAYSSVYLWRSHANLSKHN